MRAQRQPRSWTSWTPPPTATTPTAPKIIRSRCTTWTRPDLACRAGAAGGRPARLRRAVRRHGRADGGRCARRGRLLQPKVEAEIAFVLGRDLDRRRRSTSTQVRAAVDYAVAALEIVDSRVADWDITLHRHRRRQRLQRPVRARRRPGAADGRRSVDVDDDDDRRRRGGLRGQRRRLPRRPAERAALAGPDRPRLRRSAARRRGRADRRARPDGRRRSPATSSTRHDRGLGTVTVRFAATADGRSDSMSTDQGRHHRLRQHRHRPDDQGPAPLRDARDGRAWSASTRTPTASPGPAAWACRPPPTASTG